MSTPQPVVTGRGQASALVPVQYGGRMTKPKGKPMPIKVAAPKGKLK